ncbi:MAG: YigZ family protein [Candidatus Caldatribacteriota bacterium]|jgi:uncharacterized YigZ family protein|nr:YigZ family protein [Atribacterota bacterium]MDD3640512.1 YigZ family protein [Atribacterota bacterium]MDD4288900.1 YigZ family protein [Atribacterota bacterium]MDD4765058.1 YigZ family protein [Atribacterota bacterium]MDD5635192.1 YigZ family protein [Atribacterota bacterium]
MNYFQTISKNVQVKNTIKKSRFIASVKKIKSETEARSFIKKIIQQFPDATHHCWAYQIGNTDDETVQFSDGGEPANSAGPPILQAIKRERLTNVMVVVSRYFGGIKLGISGLIKAYRDTALMGLKEAGKVEQYSLQGYIIENVQYQALGNILQSIESRNGRIDNIEYGKKIKIKIYLPEHLLDWITQLVKNSTQGIGTIRKGTVRWYQKKQL